MWNETFAKINLELVNLHKLLSTYPSLIESADSHEPDHVEIMALASVLHSFYMGFENIFKRIVTEIDGGMKKTESWHVDLLEYMVVPTENRPAVLSHETMRKLRFYLGFRHVFRSHYSYEFLAVTLAFSGSFILRFVFPTFVIFRLRCNGIYFSNDTDISIKPL